MVKSRRRDLVEGMAFYVHPGGCILPWVCPVSFVWLLAATIMQTVLFSHALPIMMGQHL